MKGGGSEDARASAFCVNFTKVSGSMVHCGVAKHSLLDVQPIFILCSGKPGLGYLRQALHAAPDEFFFYTIESARVYHV